MADIARVRELVAMRSAAEARREWIKYDDYSEKIADHAPALLERIERLEAENSLMHNCLSSIKRHVEHLPSALAASIVATCDEALKEKP